MIKLFLKHKIAGLMLLVIILFLIYYYPLQKICAEINLDKYLQEQGITNDNIKSKRIFKDYKQNGYLINIVLYDDDELEYQYKYYFLSKQHKETYNILCMIRKNNVEVPLRRVKYPPLAPA